MRSVPFWSTSDRAEQAIASAGFLAGCVAVGIDPDLWRAEWLAEWADSSEVRVTLNWNPNTSVGCEMTAAEASERMRETPRPSHPPTIASAADDPVASRLAVGFVHKTFFRARTYPKGDLVVPTGVAHALDVTVGNPALCGVHLAVTLEGATWPHTDARLCPSCSKLAIGNT